MNKEIDQTELINITSKQDQKPNQNFDSQGAIIKSSQSESSLIKNRAVEGECLIHNIELIKLQQNMLYLSYLLSFLTCGLFALSFRFSLSFKKRFLYASLSSKSSTNPSEHIEEATHAWVENSDGKMEIVPIQEQLEEDVATSQKQRRKFILNRHLKYIFQPVSRCFEAQEMEIESLTHRQIVQRCLKGVSAGIQSQQLLMQFGPCQIRIPKKPFLEYFSEVLTEPFFLLQYFAVIIWVLEGFFSFPIVMISVSILITIVNYVLMSISIDKLKKIAEQTQIVKVFREGLERGFSQIDSTQLVPGDLFVVEENMQMPCDAILVSGELLLNEASLTGEVTPIPKFALEETVERLFNYVHDKRNLLCEGTRVLQTKKTDRMYVIGLVTRTGYCSFKGQIFRAVLFPKPNYFPFYRQGIKFSVFLIVLALIIYFILLYKMVEVGFSSYNILLRFADTITWMIPPALPIFFSICTSFALARLRALGVIGVDPDKILVAGKVQTMCFDKTGTLTTTGIDVLGYQKNLELDFSLGELVESPPDSIRSSDLLFRLFATCHGAYLIGKEIVGDALDVQMLAFSHWTIQNNDEDKKIKFTSSFSDNNNNNNNNNPQTRNKTLLHVLKTFEFESELQRMSCIVFDPETKKHIIFVKGSPEKISELCIQSTIPANFQSRLQSLAIKGLRIIGLSYRNPEENENEETLLQMDRSRVEQNLRFLGFLVLQNKLKDDTKTVIRRLRDANIDCKVISGDNPLTTLQTARECCLINNKQTIVLDAEPANRQQQQQQLKLKLIDSDIAQLNNNSRIVVNNNNGTALQSQNNSLPLQHPNNNQQDHAEVVIQQSNQIQINFEEKDNNKILEMLQFVAKPENTFYELAMSGNALDYFSIQLDLKKSEQQKSSNNNQSSKNNNKNIQVLVQNNINGNPQNDAQNQKRLQKIFEQLLLKAKVFARMRPEQKSLIIENIQRQDLKVGMIGDGANDCAAIKQADVGMSFAAADSSFSAPFSSSSLSIDCVEKVLIEGRATICNNIEVYRYDVSANVYKYAAVCVLLFDASNLSEFQYLFINYFTLIPALFFLAFNKPVEQLSLQLPNDNLMDKQNFFSMLGQIFIVTIGFVLCYNSLLAQTWFTSNTIVYDTEIYAKGAATGVIFFAINIFYMFSIIAFFISKPFKKSFYQNYWLLFWIFISLLFGTVIIFDPKIYIFEDEIKNNFDGHEGFLPIIFVIIYLISAVMVIYEDLIVKNLISKTKK